MRCGECGQCKANIRCRDHDYIPSIGATPEEVIVDLCEVVDRSHTLGHASVDTATLLLDRMRSLAAGRDAKLAEISRALGQCYKASATRLAYRDLGTYKDQLSVYRAVSIVSTDVLVGPADTIMGRYFGERWRREELQPFLGEAIESWIATLKPGDYRLKA
tara:strand:+ start:450 stop:932 length:483 start_codon:yes stop_codon:yes gene_type:complete